MTSEAVLVQTFVEIADTLVDDFDIVDLLTVLADRCVEVLDVDAAGIMVSSADGELRVLASSSAAMRLLELFELQHEDGPCPDAFRTGERTSSSSLTHDLSRWPRFSARAIEVGFGAVDALPMRLRGRTIGALNLFRAGEGALNEADLVAAQPFADVATIAVLQHQAASEANALNEQLTFALNSRVAIDQAKGMVAERLTVGIDDAFAQLRTYARSRNLRLVDVARDVLDGSLAASELSTTKGPTG